MSLGTGAKKGWCGAPLQLSGTAGRCPWRPCEREPALPAASNQHHHTEETSVEILMYLALYLPWTDFQQGKG